MTATIRTFFGIGFSPQVRGYIHSQGEQLKKTLTHGKIRWVPIDNYHITLRFVGNTPDDQVGHLIQCVSDATNGASRFHIHFGRVYVFPSLEHPKAIALSPLPTGPLLSLAYEVEKGVTAAGFKEDKRPFIPHVTLARTKGAGVGEFEGIVLNDSPEIEVSEFFLYQSISQEGSPVVYKPLERFLLS